MLIFSIPFESKYLDLFGLSSTMHYEIVGIDLLLCDLNIVYINKNGFS